MPSMFITEVEGTTIAEGNAFTVSRMNSWTHSNRNHAQMTLETLLHQAGEKGKEMQEGNGNARDHARYATLNPSNIGDRV